MKKILLSLIIILLACSFQIQLVTALEIELSKPSYLQGETFLADIKAEFLEPLTVQNIFFEKDGNEISLAFYTLKISEQHYYVWVNLPEETGSYSFGIENIIYKEDGKLTGDTKQASFSINPAVTPAYQDLTESAENKWSQLDTETNALALLALAWNNNLATQGLADLNARSKNQEEECWPSSCNAKETALAFLAKAEIEATENLKTSWLQDSQNNLELGLWDLSINSNTQQACHLQINSDTETLNLTQGTNTVNLDLKNKADEVTIKTNCSASSAKIIHTYLGQLNEFQMQDSDSEYQVTLNNQKCYGNAYRNSCDIESSAYASLALDKLGLEDNGLISWLKTNAETTRHKAIALYLSDSATIKNWLINNQHEDGYWSTSSLLESTTPDFESSVFAAMALEKRNSATGAERGKTWLKNQVQAEGTKNKALALGFVFTPEQTEPLATFNPAAIEIAAGNKLSTEIRNKGMNNLYVTASLEPFGLEKTLTIQEAGSETLTFDVPDKIQGQRIEDNINGSIELNYKTNISDKQLSYSIPLIILPARTTEETGITNETNETEGTWEEKETPILSGQFMFEPESIEATILSRETILIRVLLKNLASRAIEDISIRFTRSLKGILTIKPTSIISIEAGKSALINLTIEYRKTGDFSGEITAESKSQNITVKLPVTISFTENESLVNIPETPATEDAEETKTCWDFNGTICKKDELCDGIVVRTRKTNRCCFGKCIKKTNNAARIIGVIMIIIAILLIGLFLFLKLKKPKKHPKDIYGEIEKKYSKFRGKIEPKG